MARPRSDIEPRIVRAARKRFLQRGVDGASLRQIARDAKTNIGMIYYYFPTKDDLFLAVVEEAYGKLLADLSEALGAESAYEARIRRMYRRFGAMSDAELDVVRLVIREALSSSARLGRLFERFRRGHIGMMLGAVGEALARGELDSAVHPALLTMSTLAVGAAPQLMSRMVGARPPFDTLPGGERFADELVRILMRGIGAGPARAAEAS